MTDRTLGDVADFYGGSSLPEGEEFSNQTGGYLLLRVSDLNLPHNSIYVTTGSRWTANHGLKSATAPRNSLVIPKRGGAIGTNKKRILARDCILDPNLMAIHPHNKELDIRFLYHWFKTFDLLDIASGSAVPQLNKQDLRPLRLPLPPIEEQRRIAAVLDQADELRSKRRQAISLFSELVQSIFLHTFGEPNQNPHRFPRKEIKELVSNGDRINYGVIQPGDEQEGGVPLIRVGDLAGGQVRHHALKKIDPSIEKDYRRSRIKGNEILVGCVGSIGTVSLVSEREIGFNIARAVSRIPIDSYAMRRYVAEYLRTPYIQEYFRNQLRTVAQPTLNIKQLAETVILIPPVNLMESFAGRVRIVDGLKSSSLAQLDEMGNLAASLQTKAFRGQL